MKHPALRCTDIAYLDPIWRDKIYNHVLGIRGFLPPFIRENMVDLQHVGSMAFGNNQLRSDWDFNIAMKDWNHQKEAKMIFNGNIGGFRDNIERHLMELKREFGLTIDIGCVDCDTAKYNIHVSLKDMVLHHRYSEYPEAFTANANGIVWPGPDQHPINLNSFDQAKDEAPPVANQHLKWNYMLEKWQRILLNGQPSRLAPYLDTKAGQAKWSEDEWADLVPEWRQRYESRFQEYHREGGKLVQT